jgi:hypothetical protein
MVRGGGVLLGAGPTYLLGLVAKAHYSSEMATWPRTRPRLSGTCGRPCAASSRPSSRTSTRGCPCGSAARTP